MSDFFEIILGFPTVIFTVMLLISLGYWIVGVLFGLGGDSGLEGGVDGPDFDVDVDIGADGGDVDLSSDGPDAGGETSGAGQQGAFVAMLQFFGLHLVPFTIVLSTISLLGWAFSAFGVLLLSGGTNPALPLGIAIFAAAFSFAVVGAGRIAKALAPVFAVAPPTRRRNLVGRLCTIKTGRVDANFGQAEVIDAEFSSHLIQVRCDIANDLSNGSRALIVEVDDEGRFLVSPDVGSLL